MPWQPGLPFGSQLAGASLAEEMEELAQMEATEVTTEVTTEAL